MIDERSHLYLTGKLGNPAHVIAMKMGNQHIIDPVDARSFSRPDYATSISPVEPRPTGIDKNCLLRGGNDQCGLPAFHINEKDLKRLRFRGRYACAEKRACKRLQKETTQSFICAALPPCILMYRLRLLKLTPAQFRYIGLLIPSRDVQSPLTMASARKYRPDASVYSSVSREQFRAPSFFRGAQPMTSHRPYSSGLLADRLS